MGFATAGFARAATLIGDGLEFGVEGANLRLEALDRLGRVLRDEQEELALLLADGSVPFDRDPEDAEDVVAIHERQAAHPVEAAMRREGAEVGVAVWEGRIATRRPERGRRSSRPPCW